MGAPLLCPAAAVLLESEPHGTDPTINTAVPAADGSLCTVQFGTVFGDGPAPAVPAVLGGRARGPCSPCSCVKVYLIWKGTGQTLMQSLNHQVHSFSTLIWCVLVSILAIRYVNRCLEVSESLTPDRLQGVDLRRT